MKYGRYLLSALLLANTLACSDADSLYCRYPCRFVFNTNTHSHSAALMAAATGRGVFCAITTTLHGGATYYAFNTNMGTSDEVIFTAEDQRSTVLLGLNNRIIVGNGNLDDPTTFYAYDGECPNCFSPEAIPVKSRPLPLTPAGLATCAVCHREYTLNGGGGGGSGNRGARLRRFHASWAADGVLAVVN